MPVQRAAEYFCHAPQQSAELFDRLVRGVLEMRRDVEAKRLGRLEVDPRFDARGLFHRKVARVSNPPLSSTFTLVKMLLVPFRDSNRFRDELPF